MYNYVKKVFHRPTPLERAAKELGQLEHSILDATAEISWSQKRLEYYRERSAALKKFIQKEAI